MVKGLMVSVSGIRGVFGLTLTPEIVFKYAAYFGSFCKHKRITRINYENSDESNLTTIVLGRDSRTTGMTLNYAVCSALMSIGCRVIDLGIVATPTLLLAVKMLKADGGICITASHNPSHWNALKLSNEKGMFLFPDEADQFHKSMEEELSYAGWDKQGNVVFTSEMTGKHIDKIFSIPYIDYKKIQDKKFKVVIDSVNGAGGLISPRLLKKLGCEVIELNSEPNGYFAHNPEPLSKNLTQIKKAVIDNKADIGFATDPDVDRLSIISERGEAIGEELSLVLAVKYVLSKRKGSIVTNCSTTMAIDDVAAEYGVKVHRTKVGEINVGKKMVEIDSPIGGEGNGGIICPEVNYTRDATAGMAIILALMAEKDAAISQLTASIPNYYITKDKVQLMSDNLDEALHVVKKMYPATKIDKTDGLKIVGDNFWIHIRKSGTEPIVRIYVESDSQKMSHKLCTEVKEKIETFLARSS